jgi:hypothetical protein
LWRFSAAAAVLGALLTSGCLDWREVPADHNGGFRPDGPCVQLTREGRGKRTHHVLMKGGAEVPELDLVAAMGDDPVVGPLAASAKRDLSVGSKMFIAGMVSFGAIDLTTLALSYFNAPTVVTQMGGAAMAAAAATGVIGEVLQVIGSRARAHALDEYAARHPRGDCADERAPVPLPYPLDPDDPPPPPAPELDGAPPPELDGAPPPVPLKLVPDLPPPA